MDPIQRYMFDVQGFLVIEDFLPDGLVASLNASIDACVEQARPLPFSLAQGSTALGGGLKRSDLDHPLSLPEPWCDPFWEVLSFPRAIELMLEFVGEGLRHDSMKVTIMTAGTEGLNLHGGAGNPDSLSYYSVVDGVPRSGLVNIAYALTDTRPGDGGFICVPGSHKASYRLPRAVQVLDAGQELVRPVSARAGSAIVFTEALIHGTAPWTSASERRTLFSRYCPGGINLRKDTSAGDVALQDDRATPLQRALLEPAYVGGRPSIERLLALTAPATAR